LNILNLILLAILQGVFEWWPVSSTAVLILASKWMGISVSESYVYGLMLHLGSGLALFILYHKRIFCVLRKFIYEWSFRKILFNGYLWGFITSLIIAYPLYKLYLESTETSEIFGLFLIGFLFIITSIMLSISGGGVREEIDWKAWLITGFFQGLAVLPGLSRSGLTIGVLCLLGYKPEKAVEASFLLGLPALLLAGIYNFYSVLNSPFRNQVGIHTVLLLTLVVVLVSYISARTLIYIASFKRKYIFTTILAVLTFIFALLLLIF